MSDAVEIDTKDTPARLRRVGVCLLDLAIPIPAIIWKGFVISILWEWFAVPIGAPALGTAHILGLVLLFGYLTRKASGVSKDEPDLKKTREKTIETMGVGCIVLVAGWIMKGFM